MSATLRRPVVTLHPPIPIAIVRAVLFACGEAYDDVELDVRDDGQLDVMVDEVLDDDDPRLL